LDIKFNIRIAKRFILENKKKCIRISSIIAILVIALIIYLTGDLNKNDAFIVLDSNNAQIGSGQNSPVDEQETASEIFREKEKIKIVVDIEGAVLSPGVFYLDEDSRVNDAVLKAGGLTEDADTRWVNLAAKLSDGDKVYIPRKNESSGDLQNSSSGQNSAGLQSSPGVTNSTRPQEPVGIITQNTTGGSSVDTNASATNNASGLVNINTATSAQLQTLSGVGPVTAQKIIDYRENVGKFLKIEDIMRVSGIGIKTFEGFKDKIVV